MIEKIKKDITERSIKKNFTLFPQSGKSQHEFDYRFCKSELEGLKDYYFVVSKVMKYQSSSMVDYGYLVYVYDKNGNYVDNPKIQERCKGSFFDTIKDIE
jgi:hypothetical protein